MLRHMYAYHYQDALGLLIFRYDDTAHHPALESYPHHKHVRSETTVIPAEPPQLRAVLQEIEQSYPLG
jgi:hypothetical protein